jgi:hypothetical protein
MATITKSYTFSAGATILASEHNTNFDTLFNWANGNVDNANIKAGAGISLSKLALGDNATFSGDLTFAGTTAMGKLTLSANSGLHLTEGTAPTTAASQGALYTKDTSGQPELFYREESSGDEVQITSGGSVNVATTPAGALMMWAGALASPPDGWLVCAGAAVSRTTYASLFTAIGTTYGAGDGSTTFNLPNFTNVFPYGANEGGDAGNASVGSRKTSSFFSLSGNDSTVTFAGSGGPQVSGTGAQCVASNYDHMVPYLAVGFIIKT